MRTLYASQFTVLPREAQPVSGLVQALTDSVVTWATERYRRDGIAVDIQFDGGTVAPKAGHQIVASADVIDGHALVTLDWSYPHEPDQSLLWSTQVTIAASEGKVEVAVLVRITSVKFAVQPLEYDLGRPRVVPAILSAFDCAAGSISLAARPRELQSQDVRDFVNDVLLNGGRTVPVIVVSRDIWTDKPLVEAGSLQDTLAGLAIVAELKTKWAGFDLTEAVGSLYSCYKGAVRIYWPGFTVDRDDAVHHHIFLPGVIRANLERGRPLGRHLFRMLAALAAFRFTEGDVTCRVRAALEKSRRTHFDSLIEQAKKGNAAIDDELLELALSENSRLEKQKTTDDARIAELEQEIATHKANIASMYGYQQPTIEDIPAASSDDEALVGTVLDAVRRVADRRNGILLFYKSARDAAGSSDFARPEDVLKALLAIADLGDEYFDSKAKKQSMGSWEKFFEQRGLKYAPTESQNTLNMYEKDRQFTHDGRRRQMLKHLTVGRGDTKNCVQIYFEPNDETKRIEIGYVGRHLPYYGN